MDKTIKLWTWDGVPLGSILSGPYWPGAPRVPWKFNYDKSMAEKKMKDQVSKSDTAIAVPWGTVRPDYTVLPLLHVTVKGGSHLLWICP